MEWRDAAFWDEIRRGRLGGFLFGWKREGRRQVLEDSGISDVCRLSVLIYKKIIWTMAEGEGGEEEEARSSQDVFRLRPSPPPAQPSRVTVGESTWSVRMPK